MVDAPDNEADAESRQGSSVGRADEGQLALEDRRLRKITPITMFVTPRMVGPCGDVCKEFWIERNDSHSGAVAHPCQQLAESTSGFLQPDFARFNVRLESLTYNSLDILASEGSKAGHLVLRVKRQTKAGINSRTPKAPLANRTSGNTMY